jgi:hypothetical protein
MEKDESHVPRIPAVAYKIAGLILLVLLVYWLWRTYTRLPAAQPVQFRADYIPRRSLPGH